VSPEQIAFYREQFERCWPWLDAAVQSYGPTHSKDDVWSKIEEEHAQFWPWPNSAMVTQIDTSNRLKELRWWLAGGDMEEILHFQPFVEEWAKTQECKRVVVVGRRGWLRAAKDFREVATILAKDL
jgi:hypothetical protein